MSRMGLPRVVSPTLPISSLVGKPESVVSGNTIKSVSIGTLRIIDSMLLRLMSTCASAMGSCASKMFMEASLKKGTAPGSMGAVP
ncbi:hypothetical protein D3C86_1502060 [compost metagenome]